MSHALVRVFVHFVWSTKNAERSLCDGVRQEVKVHIARYARENGMHLEAFDVQPEHVHLVVRLGSEQRTGDVPKLLKGESSHWINQNDIVAGKFSWQTGYAAFSVDQGGLEAVKSYVMNQEEHHKRNTYSEEIGAMIQESGFVIGEDGVVHVKGNR